MKQTDTLYGIFETSSGADFKQFNQFNDFKCIRYCTSKDQANEIADTLNRYYMWNIFNNIKYMHEKYFNRIAHRMEYSRTVLRRDEDYYYQAYHVVELPEITTFSFHSNLTDDNDLCKVVDYYSGECYIWFTVYFNKVKDVVDDKFHIRQYLDVIEFGKIRINDMLSKYKHDSFKVITLNDLLTNNYIVESPYKNEFDDFSKVMYNDLDKMRIKNNDLIPSYYKDISIPGYNNSDLNKGTIYSVYGYFQIPKADNKEATYITHHTVEEKLKALLIKSEDMVFEKFKQDVYEKNAEDIIFDKVTFDEEKYMEYKGIEWDDQFSYARIRN